MKHIKHWLATIAALLCSMTASAHDFVAGGIYYNIISFTDLTVEVTYRGSYYDEYSNEYSGSVTIPSTVNYNGYAYSVTKIGSQAFLECSSLTAITIPEGVTSIGKETFAGCSGLTRVSLPEGMASIGSSAFVACCSLTTITIPKSVTSIGSDAFRMCYNLSTIVIPASVTRLASNVFEYCSSLTSVTLHPKVTSIGYGAFFGCSSLARVTLPDGVTEIGYSAFAGCSNLATINIPASVTRLASNVFEGCSSLTSVTIPESVTSIGDYAFYGCNSLYSVSISENSRLVNIWDHAFMDCSNLALINLPEGVTSIGDGAFYGCSRLASINIPESVTSIGNLALGSCSKLIDVYCYAETVPSTSVNAFNGSYPENATLHIPASAVENYRNIEPWSSFGTFVPMAIETAPENITLTTNEYGSGTYCSEYALDFSEVEGLKAYAATGYNTKTGIVTLTRVMTSQPGMGLFLKGEEGEYIVPVLESTDDNSLNMLVGTLGSTTINGVSDDGQYYNYRYTIKDSDEAPLFYRVDDGYTLSAGKAYLQIPVAWMPAEAKSISLRFDDEDGTTDIEEMESANQNAEVIYDLLGRKVSKPQEGGVYIVNGKKMVW